MTREDERRPSWIPLLGLAALIVAIVAVLTALATASSGLIGTPASFARPTPTPPGPITHLLRIVEEPQPQSLVGRQVQLSEPVLVQEVLSEAASWIGGGGERVLLATDGTASGVMAQLSEGQRIRVTGQVEILPPAAEAERRWRLPDGSLSEPSSAQIYVDVHSVEIVDGPASQ